MKLNKIHRGVVFTVFAAAFVVGCELIVDFDRTKIPADVDEASVPDVVVPDAAPILDADVVDDAGDELDAGDAGGELDAGDSGDLDASDDDAGDDP